MEVAEMSRNSDAEDGALRRSRRRRFAESAVRSQRRGAAAGESGGGERGGGERVGGAGRSSDGARLVRGGVWAHAGDIPVRRSCGDGGK